MPRVAHAFLFGLLFAAAGIIFFCLPSGQKLEEELGLALLFKLRGIRQPPAQAVIISIDHESAGRLNLPEHVGTWPRTVHAELVEKLSQAGAEFIVFVINFTGRRTATEDRKFSDALGAAGNVILFSQLERRSIPLTGAAGMPGTIEMDILIPPIEPLADAALSHAPFPLPKRPVRINQCWTFKASAGDMPTLPVVVMQAMALKYYRQLNELLTAAIPAVDRLPLPGEQTQNKPGLAYTYTACSLRDLLREHSWLADYLTARIEAAPAEFLSIEGRTALQALVRLCSGENSIYLNFYGPPGTIRTVSYHELLAAQGVAPALRQLVEGKIVFVGSAATAWSNQQSGFFTVFSQPDGLDLSNVELAATAFLNIHEQSGLHPAPLTASCALIAATAIILAMSGFLLSPVAVLPAMLIALAGYLAAAQFVFAKSALWLPTVIPLAVLPLIILPAALLYNYLKARREQRQVTTALSYYLPVNVVQEISNDLSFISNGGKMVYGVCLVTDASNYTTLSESLSPDRLGAVMNIYYRHLFRQVKDQGGLICNVIGDAMCALWPSGEPQVLLREKACLASVQIQAAVGQFNDSYPEHRLHTRLGLHAGYLLMGHIGAEDHFEYAPVGDIVNTAARVQNLNKQLGTTILATADAIEGVGAPCSRDLGWFLLSGKVRPVAISQILPSEGPDSEAHHQLYFTVFPEALALFRAGNFRRAQAIFRHCLELVTDDGPSRFYLQLCTSYLQTPPAGIWQGVVQAAK